MVTSKEDEVRAHAGDILIIRSHHIGEADQEAEILEVRGEAGAPPFLVRWLTDGHQALFFPGTDAVVRHRRHRAKKGVPEA